MKKLLPFLLLVFCSFTAATIRTASGSTTIATGDDNNIIVATGGNATYTLGTVSSGFTTTIINHGTGIITFSSAVNVGGGKTITTLINYPAEIQPGWIGNTIRLCYDGTTWRGY